MTLTTEQLKARIAHYRELACRYGMLGRPKHEAQYRNDAEFLEELLANREAQPVEWGAPKTVEQMIGQLKTLDPAMETTALLRMPDDFRDGNAIRQVPISISFERLDGMWLAPYKGEGRKVLAFWAKVDHREETERGDLLTTTPAPATGVDDDVRNIIGLLETNEWAEHCTETVLGSRLECEITRLMGRQAPTVPQPASQGYKLVPNEPTPEMIAAAMECDDVTFNADDTFCINFGNIYAAMLAAAPGQRE
ncbi:hypothetical protein [Serratia proteamaculans]|uniref:hypothetical protein n=1 Tax=Serratia proteamaculans TaxID=28151 RepID=UPI001F106DFC|nr:hypothetical protein [Serratia proteamaculans]